MKTNFIAMFKFFFYKNFVLFKIQPFKIIKMFEVKNCVVKSFQFVAKKLITFLIFKNVINFLNRLKLIKYARVNLGDVYRNKLLNFYLIFFVYKLKFNKFNLKYCIEIDKKDFLFSYQDLLKSVNSKFFILRYFEKKINNLKFSRYFFLKKLKKINFVKSKLKKLNIFYMYSKYNKAIKLMIEKFFINFKITKNNLFLNFSTASGKVLFFLTAGRLTSGKKKTSTLTIKNLTRILIKLIYKFFTKYRLKQVFYEKIYKIILKLNIFLHTPLMKTLINEIRYYKLPISLILDNIKITHNLGVKKKKIRRV
jgi:hypothetical protein